MFKLLICATIVVCCLGGCFSKKKSITVYRGIAMTIPYTVIVNSSSSLPPVEPIIEDTFFLIDQVYNKWNTESELSALNRATDSFQCSKGLYSMLQRCGSFEALSNGLFDPTIERLSQIWKRSLDRGTIPSKEAVESSANKIGWELLEFEESGLVRKKHPEVALDLGGIAKGFAVDQLAENLQKAGYSHIFVEWGGEVHAIGGHPDDRPWRVGIKNPNNQDDMATVLHINDGSIATSGDYQQCWTADDNGCIRHFFHIFDRTKLSPCEITQTSLASVTIQHESCMIADAIASILLLIGDKQSAQAFFEERILPQFPTTTYHMISHDEL